MIEFWVVLIYTVNSLLTYWLLLLYRLNQLHQSNFDQCRWDVNRGVELNFNIGLIQQRDLRLSMSANFTFNENRVTKLTLIEDTASIGIQVGGIAGGIGNTVQVHSINYPTFSYLMYEQLYDENGTMIQVGEQATSDINDDGIIDNADTWQTIHAFNDRNEDGVITPEDKYISYNPVPKFLIGAAVNVSYKNWYFISLDQKLEVIYITIYTPIRLHFNLLTARKTFLATSVHCIMKMRLKMFQIFNYKAIII